MQKAFKYRSQFHTCYGYRSTRQRWVEREHSNKVLGVPQTADAWVDLINRRFTRGVLGAMMSTGVKSMAFKFVLHG